MFIAKKISLVFILFFVIVTFGGIIYYFISKTENKAPEKVIEKENDEIIQEHLNRNFSAWVVDWQVDSGLKDLDRISSEGLELNNLQIFAAYFDENNHLFITEEFNRLVEQTMKMKPNGLGDTYITLVNDRILPDGTSIQKDQSIIEQLMHSADSRNKHINEIIETVNRYNFDGIEIDYEKVQQEDWDDLSNFISELNQELSENGKKLRVVLEPSVPIEELTLPQGPIYVMMAYNLYGYHSGPGPKADLSFISSTSKKLKQLEGSNYIAFSAGGFVWKEDGTITAITEKQAVELAQFSNNPPVRDSESGSLSFKYQDENKSQNTVWYADGQTLHQWAEVAEQEGIKNVAIWRLGDLQESTLNFFFKETRKD